MRRTTLFPLTVVLAASLLASCRDEPETPLAIAAAAGRATEVSDLISEGADVDGVDAAGMTAIGWAARFGNVASLDVLIAAGACVDLPKGAEVWPPLMQAIHKDHTAAAVRLLDAGADVEGDAGRKALRMAAGYGNAELARALLHAGVEPTPEMLVEAAGGAWDIDYTWRGCEPHTETVQALLAGSPGLRLPGGLASYLAVRHARREGCAEMLAILGRTEDNDHVARQAD